MDESSEQALADHLVGDAEFVSQLAQGVWRMVIETVVENYDLAQVGRELIDEAPQAIVNLAALGEVIEVWSGQGRIGGEDLLWGRVGLGYLVPDLTSDAGPGVSGEGGATIGVEVLDGVPKADATGLKQLSVGKGSAVLMADHGMNEAVVTSHRWLVTCRGMV